MATREVVRRKERVGGANGSGRRGTVVIQAAQCKLLPVKNDDSDHPAAGYHNGTVGNVERNAVRPLGEANGSVASLLPFRLRMPLAHVV
jgi:hypothetical protein